MLWREEGRARQEGEGERDGWKERGWKEGEGKGRKRGKGGRQRNRQTSLVNEQPRITTIKGDGGREEQRM